MEFSKPYRRVAGFQGLPRAYQLTTSRVRWRGLVNHPVQALTGSVNSCARSLTLFQRSVFFDLCLRDAGVVFYVAV